MIGINTSTLDTLGTKLKESANQIAKASGEASPPQLTSWVWTDKKLIEYIKKETGPKEPRQPLKANKHKVIEKKKVKPGRKQRNIKAKNNGKTSKV